MREKLRELCSVFRESLEQTKTNRILDQNELLRYFPHGCCGVTSRAIGTFLLKNGFENVYYVCGYLGNRSHAWIECEGLIVDITADQFEESTEAIVCSEESQFHRKLEAISKRKVKLSDADEQPEAWIIALVEKKIKGR